MAQGLFPAGLCQACQHECQDAAELGAGEAAAVGAGRGVPHRTGGGSRSGFEGVAVKIFIIEPRANDPQIGFKLSPRRQE